MAILPMIQKIEQEFAPQNFPSFRVGDTIKVHFRISEGGKERVQAFEGVLIAHKKGGIGASIRVRKISFGEGVEKIFPLSSPRIEKIELMRTGKVRRARLYYLRELRGKKARIKERSVYKTAKKD